MDSESEIIQQLTEINSALNKIASSLEPYNLNETETRSNVKITEALVHLRRTLINYL